MKDPFCETGGACRVFSQPGGLTFVVFMDGCANISAKLRNDPKTKCTRLPAVFELRNGNWVNVYERSSRLNTKMTSDEEVSSLKRESEAMESGDVRIVPITKRKITVGDKPAGNEFE